MTPEYEAAHRKACKGLDTLCKAAFDAGYAFAKSESAWRGIESAPYADRVLVCGYSKQTKGCAGYWWWHEGCVFNGKDPDHPGALFWAPIVLPTFPNPPSDEVTL